MDITTRTKIDAIWQGMWDNGMADAKTNITQITYLLFIILLKILFLNSFVKCTTEKTMLSPDL